MTSTSVTIRSGMPLEFKDKSSLRLSNDGHDGERQGKDTSEHIKGTNEHYRNGKVEPATTNGQSTMKVNVWIYVDRKQHSTPDIPHLAS